jgi:hypothetical protein
MKFHGKVDREILPQDYLPLQLISAIFYSCNMCEDRVTSAC